MPRVKRGTHRRATRKKTLKLASGYFLTKSKLNRAAQEAVERGLKFAYVGRKNKKREYRSLWIVRINASCRAAGLSYSQFLHGLKAANMDLNRKVLADIAANDEDRRIMLSNFRNMMLCLPVPVAEGFSKTRSNAAGRSQVGSPRAQRCRLPTGFLGG